MSTLPILYRSERGTGDWLAVPRRCPACRGNLAEDVLGDAVTCLLCARPVADLRDVRPAAAARIGPARRGRPPLKPSKRRCQDCDGPIAEQADRRCKACYLASITRPPKAEWPRCATPGCERVSRTFSARACQTHYVEDWRARRAAQGVAS